MKKSNSLKIIFLLGLYYYLLIWGYENLIASKWSYQGFVNESSVEGFVTSFIGAAITIFSFVIIDRKNTPSSIVMNLFNLVFYMPLYVFIAYNEVVRGFFLFCILYQLTLFLFYLHLPVSFRPLLPRSKRYFTFIIGFVLIATLFINGYYNGFQIKIDLTDVYENRLEAREASIPSILRYIKAAAYFVGIVALMYALKVRNWGLVTFVVVIQLMSFAFGASKTQFFSIFVCFIAFFFYTDKLRLWAPVSLLGLIIISILEFTVFSTSNVSDVFTRRTLFMPAQISHMIYDFFETPGREFLYLRDSIFRFLGFDDPYEAQDGFQRYIGYLKSGNRNENANTGLLGNDYAQFGWWSLLIFPFLRVYLLRMYDYCARGVDNRIIVTLSIFITFTYISGAFFMVLVTKAILLVNYLLYCFPRERDLNIQRITK